MSEPTFELHAARERVQRMLYAASGFGGLVFGGILFGKIVSQFQELNNIYAITAVAFGVVLPASLVFLARMLPLKALRAYVATIVLGFVAMQVLWLPAITTGTTESDPWLQGFNAVHGTMLAVLLATRVAWSYALVQGPLVAIVQYVSTGTDVKAALLNGVGAVLFCGITVGVALALMGAASSQDVSAARARAQASVEASKRTRQREQARIDAIVHDNIMSVLLVASREEHSPRVASQAKSALSSVATLSIDDDAEKPDYAPDDAIIALRTAVTDQASQVAFWHSSVGRTPIPAVVIQAFSEAIAEAVRNSLLYAGGEAGDFVHRVVTVNLTDDTLRATIQDTGRGFIAKAVSERRLGIRVSILERMRLLPGGEAKIDSQPGRGTTITLTWVRQR